MGKSLFIVLTVCLMYSGVQGESMSSSCSMVNGRMICSEQTSSGNTAMASSSASSGPQGSSQNTYAGAGNPNGQWDSSGQRFSTGNGGPSPSNDYFDFGRTDFQEPPSRRFDGPSDGACSYSTPRSPQNYGPNAAPTSVVGGFGFASAGNIDPQQILFNFVPRIPNTPQDSSVPNGGLPFRNNFGNDNSGFQEANRRFDGLPDRNNFNNNNFGFQKSTRRFDGPSVGGMSYSYSSSGSMPNVGANAGPAPTVGGFGFASVGNVSPGFPFSYVSSFTNSQQNSPRTNGGGFPGGAYAGGFAGGFAGPGPVPFDPFRFVFGGRR